MICENEVENGDAAFDEIELVGAAIAEVFFFDLAIEPPREEVANRSTLRKPFDAGVSLPFELGSLRYKKPRFGLAIAESLERVQGVLTRDEFRHMLERIAEGSEKLPDLPTEGFSRESFYEDRVDGRDPVPGR